MFADGIALALGFTGFMLAAVCVTATLSFADESSSGSVLCPFAIMTLAGAAGTFVLAPPIIHFAHDRAGPGLISLGLRVMLPAAAIGVGAASDEPGVVAALFLSSLVGAAVIDWLILTRPPRRTELQWSLVPADGGARLVLRRAF